MDNEGRGIDERIGLSSAIDVRVNPLTHILPSAILKSALHRPSWTTVTWNVRIG